MTIFLEMCVFLQLQSLTVGNQFKALARRSSLGCYLGVLQLPSNSTMSSRMSLLAPPRHCAVWGGFVTMAGRRRKRSRLGAAAGAYESR